jgi:hypothetical protein
MWEEGVLCYVEKKILSLWWLKYSEELLMNYSILALFRLRICFVVRAGIYGNGAVFVDNFLCCVHRVKYGIFVLLFSH